MDLVTDVSELATVASLKGNFELVLVVILFGKMLEPKNGQQCWNLRAISSSALCNNDGTFHRLKTSKTTNAH